MRGAGKSAIIKPKETPHRGMEDVQMGFIATQTLAFIVLKCLDLIAGSWVWVFCTVWLTVLLVAVLFLLILVGGRIKNGKW